MKLITKTTLYYLIATLLLFAAGGIVFYFQLKHLMDEEVTENLYSAKENIRKTLAEYDSLPPDQMLSGEYLSFTAHSCGHDVLKDTAIYSETEEEDVDYRVLSFPAGKPGNEFTVSVGSPKFESDDLIETIVLSFAVIVLFLILTLLLLSRFISKRLWKPFFDTLHRLQNYKHPSEGSLVLAETKTIEFSNLNHAIEELSQRVSDGYEQLKTFTANASHEMQTPLAAILLETENLMQNSNLSERSVVSLANIHKTVKQAEKLVQSLLMLAKVSNGQFAKENINFSEAVFRKLDDFRERMEFSGIDLSEKIADKVVLNTSQELADTIVSNLLSNAIRHCGKGGRISVELTADFLQISNSGDPLPFPEEQLFTPFVRDLQKEGSSGLGLALVKEIAKENGWKLHYEFIGGGHLFRVIF